MGEVRLPHIMPNYGQPPKYPANLQSDQDFSSMYFIQVLVSSFYSNIPRNCIKSFLLWTMFYTLSNDFSYIEGPPSLLYFISGYATV